MVERGYADFVRERQSELLRAAALVSGSPEAGRALLVAALVDLARHWPRVREDRPDAYLRRSLYGRAIHPGHGPSGAEVDPVAPVVEADRWEGDVAEQRHRVVRALGDLAPLQRAVLVDRSLEQRSDAETAEVLGLDPATERAALDDAMRRLAPLVGVRPGAPRTGPEPGEEIWHLLELAGDDVVEEDLVEEAWAIATTRRRRVGRRVVLGGIAVGAAGAGAALLLDRPQRRAEDVVGRVLPTVEVAGIHVALAPRPGDEVRLLRYPDAAGLGLRPGLGPGDPSGSPRLVGPLTAPLRAVYLVSSSGRRGLDVVLETPDVEPTHHLVAPSRADEVVRARDHLGPRTISSDRHRVVLPSTGGIVVIDPRIPGERHLAVPDATLTWAAWAPDEVTAVAASIHAGWAVDTSTGVVREVGLPVCGDLAVLGSPDENLEVQACGPSGHPGARRAVAARGLVPTVESAFAANRAGWVAGEAFLGPELQAETGRRSGLVAVPPADAGPPVVLAADGHIADAQRFRVLAWADEGTLLLESRSQTGANAHRVLAWDVAADRLWAVAEVEPFDDRTWFTGLYTL